MGKLTGIELVNQVNAGRIEISPFDINKVNPNSYNVLLAPTLKTYVPMSKRWVNGQMEPSVLLDPRNNNPTEEFEITEKGFVLMPGILYLGRTVEVIHTKHYVPVIDGRSSIGRLGVNVHATAGFGDIGFRGTLTLEISVIHPTIIYPYMEIAQISFDEAIGDTSYQYNGRYNGQIDVTPSRFGETKVGTYEEFLNKENKDA